MLKTHPAEVATLMEVSADEGIVPGFDFALCQYTIPSILVIKPTANKS